MARVNFCLLNSILVPESEAKISAFDRGFLYADGLFETLRAYGGKPFLLDQHWRRLSNSARFLGIDVPTVEPAALLTRLLEANDLADASLRITLSRGALPAGPRVTDTAGEPTLLIRVRPLRPNLKDNAEHGIEAARLPWPLRARGLPFQGHKTLAYLPSVLALGAVPEGIEPLLETTEGHVAETATANVFWSRDGRLFTPSLECGCLPGITRAAVLRVVTGLGISLEEGAYSSSDLAGAEEAFVTNSVVEITPLIRLDGRALGSGRPGPITRALQKTYRELVSEATGAPP